MMRWRGERPDARVGQTGSQKPHSMHRSAVAVISVNGLRFADVLGLVVAQEDARVQDVVGIEESLDLAEDRVGSATPFPLDVGSHVPARAMFGLERAIVFSHHQSRRERP